MLFVFDQVELDSLIDALDPDLGDGGASVLQLAVEDVSEAAGFWGPPQRSRSI